MNRDNSFDGVDPYSIRQFSDQKQPAQKRNQMNLSFDQRKTEVVSKHTTRSQSMNEFPNINNSSLRTLSSKSISPSKNELPLIYSDSTSKMGIDGYRLPKQEYLLLKPKSLKWIKQKSHETFVDEAQKQKNYLPPPNFYQIPSNWKTEMSNYFNGGSPNKGKFLKSDRVTFQDEIMRKNKKQELPSPGTYNPKILDKAIGLCKQNVEKGLFIDEARFVGHQTPGAIYNYDVTSVKPKIFGLKIIAENTTSKSVDKIEKSERPSPGQYESDNSYKKTQLSSIINAFSKKDNKNFVDLYKKTKEYLPPVGHYQNTEAAYKKITSNPISIRKKRH